MKVGPFGSDTTLRQIITNGLRFGEMPDVCAPQPLGKQRRKTEKEAQMLDSYDAMIGLQNLSGPTRRHRAPDMNRQRVGGSVWTHPDTKRLEGVLAHIESNVDVSLSLDELADIANLSVFQFARVFKRALGVSPHAYIIQTRVQHASRLLRESSLPICDIAYAVGFSSQSHMTTTLKKLTGQTPGQIRRILAQTAVPSS